MPVCQHLSLSGLYYLSSRFLFQTYTSSQSWPWWIRPLQESSSLYRVRHGKFSHCFPVTSQSFAHHASKMVYPAGFWDICGGERDKKCLSICYNAKDTSKHPPICEQIGFIAYLVCKFRSKNAMETGMDRPCHAPAKVFQIKKNRQGCIILAFVVQSLFFFFF